MEKLKKNKLLFAMILTIVFVVSTATTYAAFSLTSTGNASAKSVTISGSTLHITYNGGSAINASGIEPGWSTSKTLTVTNDGTVGVTYKLYYQTLVNEILGSTSESSTGLTTDSELKISATCSNTITSGTVPSCSGIEETSVAITKDKDGNAVTHSNVIKDKIYIASGETQTYTITYEFTNETYLQNYNQGKTFAATIGVADSTATYDVTFTGLSGVNSVTVSSTPQTITVTNGSATATGLELGTHTIKIGDTTNTFELRTADTPLCTNTGTKTIYASKTETTQTVSLTIDASNNVTAYSTTNYIVTPKSSLSAYTWSEIKELSEALADSTISTTDLSSTYNISIGSTKDATINGESHTFRIVGFNHDVDASGNTLGMTFEQVDLMNSCYRMSGDSNWINSNLFSIISVFTIESDLDNAIKATKKPCIDSTITYVTSKLWIMSETEIAGTNSYTYGDNVAEGIQYTYYVANNTATDRIKQMGTSNEWYWLRSPYGWDDVFGNFAFANINSNGSIGDSDSYDSVGGVSVCFCI